MKRTQARGQTFRQILARLEAQNAGRLIEKARTANRLAKLAPDACARSRAYRVKVNALLYLCRRFPTDTRVRTDPRIPFFVVKYVSPRTGGRCGQHTPPRSDFFRGKTFAQISPLLVEKFKRTLREAETNRGTRFSPRHVNYHLQILFRIFSLAVERNEVAAEDNPCKRVKFLAECSRRTRYLLDEEEPRLFEHLVDERAHLREMVTVAVGTGMRLGDQLNLKKSKVDFQRNVVLVPNSKTGRDYPVPMNQEVRETLLKLARENPSSEYVFVNPKTGQPYRCIKRAFKKACELAKIYDLHWHDLRHTFGTRLAEAGFSEATIAELMGHTDPKTTRRYTHATDRAKHAAVQAARPRAYIEEQQKDKTAKVVSMGR